MEPNGSFALMGVQYTNFIKSVGGRKELKYRQNRLT